MQKRRFGNTSLLVSEIGFGAWAIGGGTMVGETAIGWGNADDAVSKKAIHAALDAGINFFDTADIYGLGHSENLIGSTIGNRSDIVIATKGGNVAKEGQFTTDYSYDYLIKACEASLKRLKRESIDYYQLHTARISQLEQGDCIRAMEDLQKQGKIRYWGLSLNTFSPLPEAQFLLEAKKANGFQLVQNLINQRALPLLSEAAAHGYGVIARMPLQFGLLTGKFDQEIEFADNDHRKGRLTPSIIETAKTSLFSVWKLCEKYQCTKTELSLSYLLSYDAISTVIPGIRTPEQVALNTSHLFKLDQEDRQQIEELGRGPLRELMEKIQQLG